MINIGRDYGYIKVRAPVNTYMIIACFLVFILTNLLQPTHTIVSRQAPLAPLFASPVRQVLMYDYPLKYEILNQLIAEYGVDALTLPANLSQSAQSKIQKFLQTPYWEGVYGNLITNRANSQLSWFSDAPLFEKIRQGEIWRLVTPIFLHGDLIHIFFNMIWLYVIGKQLALNIGSFRYLIFVILTAAFSNTAQYLMTGANFLGFSGVICAMLTFIWTRQKIAPWEFYPLQNTTFIFMMIFVFGMAAFQTLSFLSEMTVQVSFAPGIANTAHISGLLAGLALGRLNFFAGKS